MTRIFCKPLSVARGSAAWVVMQFSLGVLTLLHVKPVEAASGLQGPVGTHERPVARLNRSLPVIHDATVSILSASPRFWQRPAGDPTALNPVAARFRQPALSGWEPARFSALSFHAAAGRTPSVSVDALTTTFYVNDSPAKAKWSADADPLTTVFSRD